MFGALAAVLFTVGACSATSESSVVGTVTQVSGESGVVESFIVRTDAGRSVRFVPADGLTCNGESLDHLRDHLVDRTTIEVDFDEGDDGELIAVAIRRC